MATTFSHSLIQNVLKRPILTDSETPSRQSASVLNSFKNFYCAIDNGFAWIFNIGYAKMYKAGGVNALAGVLFIT